MKRIRWFSAHLPASFRALAQKMKENPFTHDSYDGFVVNRVRDSSIEARYIEKLTYQEIIVDPFGNEVSFNRISYRQVLFSLFADFPHLELWDAPRKTQSYVSKLLELTDFSFSINHLDVNVLDWVASFHRQVGKNIWVDSVQISGLELERGVSAKVLVKGNKDVREALENFSKDRSFSVEKIQIKIPHNRLVVPVHLANNGSARVPEEVMNDILPLLRTSLPNTIKG